MFSIVIPLYNKERQIEKTLNAVLNQTFKDFEIVIVNDGSTDDSVDIVNGFQDARIRLIDKLNGGVSSARNRGIKEAKFDWVAFLDADDIWEETKLEKVADIISSNPEVPWIFSAYRSIKGNKVKNYDYPYNGIFDDALDALNRGLSIQTSTVVVRREFFLKDEKLFFAEGINNSEDREVWYKLIFRFPNPYYLQEILTYYIIDDTGHSLNTGAVNFSFLTLKERLSNDVELLTPIRREKFMTFIDSFNRKVCWIVWVNNGWNLELKKAIPRKEEMIMKLFSNFPFVFKKALQILFK